MTSVELPDLRVVLLTYNRANYASITLRSLLENIEYAGKIYVHIADDGTSDQYRSILRDIAGGYKNVAGVSESNAERGGYGKNYNLAMQVAHCDKNNIILPLEDDWKLVRTLRIEDFLPALQDGTFGCIRLGYVGFTQELKSSFVTNSGHYYLDLDPESSEPHVFAGHPRLETVPWSRSVGPWPEGEQPGATEFIVAHRKEARSGVAWPLDVHPRGDLFVHIGTERSY